MKKKKNLCEAIVARQNDLEPRFEAGERWARGTGADREDYGWGGVRETANEESWRKREKGSKTAKEREDKRQEDRRFDRSRQLQPCIMYEKKQIYLLPAWGRRGRAERGASLNATSEVYLYKLMESCLRRGSTDSLIYPLISVPRK